MKKSIAAVSGLMVLFSGSALAQAFPSKQMRIVAPYTAGGAVDLMARHLCERFPQSLGQSCIVENRTGAGGMIGMDHVAKAEPDGHTLVVVPNNVAIIPSLFSKVPYDTLTDLAPVGLISGTPMMIGTHPSVPAKNIKEFISWVKANDGKVNFTTCGPASPQHLSGEILAGMAGFKWTHVPYKGCADAMTAVLGNTVPVFISTVAHVVPQAKAGKMRAHAVLSEKRSHFASEYPTVAESGFPDLKLDLWFGLMAPGKTPAPVIARLNSELNKVLQQEDLKAKLATQFYEPLGGTPERFAAAIRHDMKLYGKAAQDAGIPKQ